MDLACFYKRFQMLQVNYGRKTENRWIRKSGSCQNKSTRVYTIMYRATYLCVWFDVFHVSTTTLSKPANTRGGGKVKIYQHQSHHRFSFEQSKSLFLVHWKMNIITGLSTPCNLTQFASKWWTHKACALYIHWFSVKIFNAQVQLPQSQNLKAGVLGQSRTWWGT